MIRLTDDIWIGDSADEQVADVESSSILAILNVAQDMHSTRGWRDGVESAHAGLIDGPGNTLSAYYAAVLMLHSLVERRRVLVCCHSGGRALAVTAMYMNLTADRDWDELISVLRERVDPELPEVNPAHRGAFDEMNWGLLRGMIK